MEEKACNCGLLPTLSVFSISTLIFFFNFSPAIASDVQTYIVHVTQPESTVLAQADRDAYYRSFLPFSIQSAGEPKRLVHTYHNVLSGFAARLTEEEVKNMQEKDGFVFAKPERKLKLLTTHTPNFLGLHVDMGYWKDSNFGKGVIVGMLDTGLLPSHPSFSEAGMPAPPAKWKGRCEFNVTDCNNKLIGARNFVTTDDMSDSPLDTDGHGTHTSSTAAGAFVQNAEVLGNAHGTASGMAPWAHLAMYRVCLPNACAESDILAGIDSAVSDGVDVLSVSIGGTAPRFSMDNIAIGSFGAIQKGIFVSCGAGNDGPFNSTLSNEAPWVLTVGASTMDRSIRATSKLGNAEEFDGESLFQPKDFPSTLMPLVYAGANSKPDSAFCGESAFEGMDVIGKVVLCEKGGDVGRIDKGRVVLNSGGAAMILMNDEESGFSTRAEAHVLPASHVNFADGVNIKAYINSSSAPMATIVFKGTIIGSAASPAVTSFSSRGPSRPSPGILKPDIIGPGVNVLAAWPFSLDNSTSKSTFNIISGTSMSTPHLSGIAALIKSTHPDWSPAAIKSALMTTADLQNSEGKPILDHLLKPADLFATGAGHVNPSKANNPGLVYDIQPSDYMPYLCGLGYSDKEVTVIAHKTVKCADISSISEGDLNYPSFSVKLGDTQKFSRTLTNVGAAISSYNVQIFAPKGVEVTVEPEQLNFSEMNQKLTYSASFGRTVEGGGLKIPYAQGFLKWVSTSHTVRSPISVSFE